MQINIFVVSNSKPGLHIENYNSEIYENKFPTRFEINISDFSTIPKVLE